MKKGIFHQMAHSVNILIIIALFFPIPPGWNNCLTACLHCLIKNLIAIITTVCKQKLRGNAVNQSCCLRAIRCGTCCNSNSDRHTMRIHGQMYFTVEPPFVRPIPWLPPLAPAAWG